MLLHKYKIWTNDGLIEKEDAREMSHVDPQAAIQEFAKMYDRNGDFYFAQNFNGIIFVEDEEGHITKWSILVETVPQYYATKIK